MIEIDTKKFGVLTTNYESDLEQIITQIAEYYPNFDERRREKVARAFCFAEHTHRDQKRASGEPYFTHPIAATKILLQIEPDLDTVCACLMHDVIEDTPVTADEIEAEFDSHIRFLCEGVEKVAKVRISKTDSHQKKFQNVQKLFVAMAQDMRVIFIKLADRIHNLSTLKYVPLEKRERIAKESLEIYVPIAEKFGVNKFKNQLEHYCFEALYPKEFHRLQTEVEISAKARLKFIDKARKDLLRKLGEEGLQVHTVKARKKTMYSLFLKMQRKGFRHVDEVYDLFGVRVILESESDCYRALGVIHANWKPVSNRFKDYIALPKPNGYKSLHTTVLGLGQNHLPTEVQIRTAKMDLDAEKGPAAHWAYKTSGGSNFDEEYLKKTAWVPNKITKSKDYDPQEFFQAVANTLFSERIYVFTPKGDLKFFAKGATPVDLAYAIHSDIGNSCTGALVNGIIKPLNYQMQNGDIVSILTKPGRRPNPLWLNFIISNSAKDKIRSFFRKEGEEIVMPASVEPRPTLSLPVRKKVRPAKKPVISGKPSDFSLVIGGETDMPYRLAECCMPEIGDPIVAHKGRGLKFMVHAADCSELEHHNPQRIFEANFLIEKRLKVCVVNRKNVLLKITAVIAKHDIDIYRMKSRVLADKTGLLDFVLHVHSENEYQALLKDIERNPAFVRFVEQ
ncbi:hypothetical protein CSB37_00770 [bacterium DOLZORAL124_38_8]|nr:MAG: hypothetical protein CSB37_00770 [bacterium DOLZORAL124_38_8]